MATMKLSYLTLPVDGSQLVSTRDWYVEVIGLAKVWQSDDFVLLEGEGGARLGLHRGRPLSEPEKVQIHFEVPDVDRVHEYLTGQGIVFRQGPADTSWGYRVASLQDPIGHTVELFSDLGTAGDAGHRV
jgi:catechol 2,3-dioxygenase-like lactoylglutathione lyase family enzyme